MRTLSHSSHGSIRILFATACAAFVTAFATPDATAGEADGVYQVKRISTSDSISIPQTLIAQTVSSNGTITITDNQITIQRKKWLNVLNHFNFVFNGGTSRITGPRSITLEPSGDSFVGSTSRPVVVQLTGNFLGIDITMELRTTCRAKLTGDVLVLTMPVRISTDGETTATGTIRVVARR